MSEASYTFGERLRLYRRGAAVSQETLADDVGMTRQTVINWEKGQYLPNRETILNVARRLALSEEETDELLILASHPPYFGTVQGTASSELIEAYCKDLREAGLIRDFGPPVPWSEGWLGRVLMPEGEGREARSGLAPEDLLKSHRSIVATKPGLGGTTLLCYVAHISASHNFTPVFVDLATAWSTDPEPATETDLARLAAWAWSKAQNYNPLELRALARALRDADKARKTFWLLDNLQALSPDRLALLIRQVWRLSGQVMVVTWKVPSELRSKFQVVSLEGMEDVSEQRRFIANRLSFSGAEDQAQHILRLFDGDARLRFFRPLPLALEAACALSLEKRLSGSRVIEAVIDGLLRKAGASSEDERRRTYFYLGNAAMERLHLNDRQLLMDAQQVNLAWERICTRRPMAFSAPDDLLNLAARGGIVRTQSGATWIFSRVQFRDCMAAVVEDGETWSGDRNVVFQPHLLYVAGISSDTGHLASLLRARWREHADPLGMGILLVADYAVEMKRGGETSPSLSPLISEIKTGLERLFRADDGLDMKRAVLRRLRGLDPDRSIRLIQGEMMADDSAWRSAVVVELIASLDIGAGWDLLQRGGAHEELLRTARDLLWPSHSDMPRCNNYISALLALKSSDSHERLEAIRFLACAQFPEELTLTHTVRKELGSGGFWRASGLRGGKLFGGDSVRYSQQEVKILLVMLLSETLHHEPTPETRYLITRALARLQLLPTLLRVEPLLPSPLWSLALHYGFWVADLNRVITTDGRVLAVNENIDEHLRPVCDWSAHAWGLE